jgi:hypothetical protein
MNALCKRNVTDYFFTSEAHGFPLVTNGLILNLGKWKSNEHTEHSDIRHESCCQDTILTTTRLRYYAL